MKQAADAEGLRPQGAPAPEPAVDRDQGPVTPAGRAAAPRAEMSRRRRIRVERLDAVRAATTSSRSSTTSAGRPSPTTPSGRRCYCHYYHVPKAMPWKDFTAAQNRTAMAARIDTGETEGFLAYAGDEVVGWLNAQPYAKLPHCLARLGVEPLPLPVPPHEAAAIVCFVVAPAWRRRGVARALLDGALASFAARGITVVDAFPFTDRDSSDATDHYTARRRCSTRRASCGSARPRTSPSCAGRSRRRADRDRSPGATPPPPHAAAALPRADLRAGARLREPAAVRAVDRAAARHARSSCSRRGRRAGRASTSRPTSLAYVPFGFFVALMPRRAAGGRAAVGGGGGRAPRCRSRWRRCRCSCRRATRT